LQNTNKCASLSLLLCFPAGACGRFVGFEHFRDGYRGFFVLAGWLARLWAATTLEISLGLSPLAWG